MITMFWFAAWLVLTESKNIYIHILDFKKEILTLESIWEVFHKNVKAYFQGHNNVVDLQVPSKAIE